MIRAHCKGGAIRVMLQKTTDGRTNEEIWIPLHRDLAPSSGWWAHEPADKARRKRVRQPSGLTHLKRRVGRSCCISARTLILARSESSDKGAGRGQQEIRGEAQHRRENATERSDLER